MTEQSYGKYKWIDGELHLHNKSLGIYIGPDQVNPRMYRIGWETGELSKDRYNKVRAMDNAIRWHQRHLNSTETL